ncbi:hypothetical protein DSO57_1005070 [Entomophthora muscae]|uniref:Uncharacterized protein n=1 Tax=Entomophthora muscae TaxID=34485 RepID=A0ACC2USX2_9FUNG|nr:hypothetical protein DSO57_1005070 [Entomophthora muscae]
MFLRNAREKLREKRPAVLTRALGYAGNVLAPPSVEIPKPPSASKPAEIKPALVSSKEKPGEPNAAGPRQGHTRVASVETPFSPTNPEPFPPSTEIPCVPEPHSAIRDASPTIQDTPPASETSSAVNAEPHVSGTSPPSEAPFCKLLDEPSSSKASPIIEAQVCPIVEPPLCGSVDPEAKAPVSETPPIIEAHVCDPRSSSEESSACNSEEHQFETLSSESSPKFLYAACDSEAMTPASEASPKIKHLADEPLNCESLSDHVSPGWDLKGQETTPSIYNSQVEPRTLDYGAPSPEPNAISSEESPELVSQRLVNESEALPISVQSYHERVPPTIAEPDSLETFLEDLPTMDVSNLFRGSASPFLPSLALKAASLHKLPDLAPFEKANDGLYIEPTPPQTAPNYCNADSFDDFYAIIQAESTEDFLDAQTPTQEQTIANPTLARPVAVPIEHQLVVESFSSETIISPPLTQAAEHLSIAETMEAPMESQAVEDSFTTKDINEPIEAQLAEESTVADTIEAPIETQAVEDIFDTKDIPEPVELLEELLKEPTIVETKADSIEAQDGQGSFTTNDMPESAEAQVAETIEAPIETQTIEDSITHKLIQIHAQITEDSTDMISSEDPSQVLTHCSNNSTNQLDMTSKSLQTQQVTLNKLAETNTDATLTRSLEPTSPPSHKHYFTHFLIMALPCISQLITATCILSPLLWPVSFMYICFILHDKAHSRGFRTPLLQRLGPWPCHCRVLPNKAPN